MLCAIVFWSPCDSLSSLPFHSLVKTEVMAMTRPGAKCPEMTIRVDGVRLKQVDVFKYLGFLVTPTLSTVSHRTRATKRARAAAVSISTILKKLGIFDLGRLNTYLSSYVESQFYGLELMQLNALDAVASARSCFVRSLFDLPISTSHELATILFNSPPLEILFLRRLRTFLKSIKKHDFQFMRDALMIDSEFASSPLSLHCNLTRLIRRFDPKFSFASGDEAIEALDRILFRSNATSFIFNFIKFGDSDSLSFYRCLSSPASLETFRAFLQELPYSQMRLMILFCSSLLRFRFCVRPREWCPLCGRPWLWMHFFLCRKLEVAPGLDSAVQTERVILGHISCDEWQIFLAYVRFYLLQWRDLVHDPNIPEDVIDQLVS